MRSFPGLLWAMRNDSLKDSFSNATITQCELRYSSYNVSFKFTSDIQTVNRSVLTVYNNVGAFDIPNLGHNYTSNDTFLESLGYQSIMAAFGAPLIGSVFIGP